MHHRPIHPQIFYSSNKRNRIPAPLSCHLPNGLQSGLHISWLGHHIRFFSRHTTSLHKHPRSNISFSLHHEVDYPSTCHHIYLHFYRTWFLYLVLNRSPNLLYTIFLIYSSSQQPKRYLDHAVCFSTIHLHICLHWNNIGFQIHLFYYLSNLQRICLSLPICSVFPTRPHLEAVSISNEWYFNPIYVGMRPIFLCFNIVFLPDKGLPLTFFHRWNSKWVLLHRIVKLYKIIFPLDYYW